MNKNRKECIDDLNYIRKAFTKGTMYHCDAFIDVIDTLVRYFEKGGEELHCFDWIRTEDELPNDDEAIVALTRGERFDYREKYDVYMPYCHDFNNDFFVATYSHWFPIPSVLPLIPKMGIVNEDKVRNKTMTNADKIIQLLQNPDENVEEFNSLIPNVINCPLYIGNNYDGFCNMSSDSGSCLECTKDWLYKEVTNEVLEV